MSPNGTLPQITGSLRCSMKRLAGILPLSFDFLSLKIKSQVAVMAACLVTWKVQEVETLSCPPLWWGLLIDNISWYKKTWFLGRYISAQSTGTWCRLKLSVSRNIRMSTKRPKSVPLKYQVSGNMDWNPPGERNINCNTAMLLVLSFGKTSRTIMLWMFLFHYIWCNNIVQPVGLNKPPISIYKYTYLKMSEDIE